MDIDGYRQGNGANFQIYLNFGGIQEEIGNVWLMYTRALMILEPKATFIFKIAGINGTSNQNIK